VQVSEIFYSVQGEGSHQGRAAAFVRFFGCDLDCDFCDEPLHRSTQTQMSEGEILAAIEPWPSRLVVLTGGEPSLEDRNHLITILQQAGFEVAVETNGYSFENIQTANWITYSPKDWAQIHFDAPFSELKLVVQATDDPAQITQILTQSPAPVFLQPMSLAGDPAASKANVTFCLAQIKSHPDLRLSLGLQRFLGFH